MQACAGLNTLAMVSDAHGIPLSHREREGAHGGFAVGRVRAREVAAQGQTISNNPAAPIPPAVHIDTTT